MEQLNTVVGDMILIVEWIFLAWLFYYTRLKSVLVILVWIIVRFASEYVWVMIWSPLSMRIHYVGWYYNEWKGFTRVVDFGVFAWMLLSLVQWSRPEALLLWKRTLKAKWLRARLSREEG